MKKLIVVALAAYLLVGCASEPVSVVTEVEDDVEIKAPTGQELEQMWGDVVSLNGHQYYLWNYIGEDVYLWRDDQKLSNKPLHELEGRAAPYDLSYSVWHVLEYGDELRVYYTGAGGCAGCSSLSSTYFVVKNDELAVGKYEDADLSYLFGRYGYSISTISPDGTKIAFVKVPNPRDIEESDIEESVWVFDFLTGKETKVGMIKEGYNVTDVEPYRFVPVEYDPELLYWDESNQLQIGVPFIAAGSDNNEDSFDNLLVDDENGRAIYDRGHAFDFDNDGIDEQVVYYKQALTNPVKYNGSEVDWNGAFKILKRENNEWVSIFEDEGTVGKEGYGVYNMLQEDDFFKIIDSDLDGVEEVLITSWRDGTGAYSDSYFLKWEDNKIVKAQID